MNTAKSRALTEEAMKWVFFTCALLSAAAVLIICLFLFANGVPAISKIGVFNFLLGQRWKPSQDIYGIFPMIVGSVYVTAGAIAIGVPIGIMTAVFLSFYCPKKLYGLIKPAVDLLAGIPSIVYGFFGLVVIVPVMQQLLGTGGKGVLTASVLLGIMILPTVISTTEASLRAVPPIYFEGSLALGATKERSIFKSVFPAAKSGVLSGVILGIGRAIGETMAVVMVAGNQAVIPASITAGVRTMTANIVLEMGYAADLHREALIATAVVLFVFILIINLCFSAIKLKGKT
jgi:phosphate ABC transporter, permease protein PstC